MHRCKDTENPLGTEKISSLLIRFSIPTTFTLLVNNVYNLVDQIYIGRGVGVDGIAATNVAFPLTVVSMALALMLGDGCASFISLALGQGKEEDADKAFGTAFWLLIAFGVLLALAGFCFTNEIARLFGATGKIIPLATDYMRIVVFGLPFIMICAAFTAIIRADGSPKYSMKCMLIGAVLNIILDPIMIFGLGLGVKGAAYATVFSQLVSAVLMLLYLKRLQNLELQRAYLRLDFSFALRILRLGVPSFTTQILNAFVQITMNNLMGKYGANTVYGSEIAISVYGMMMKIYQIAHSMFVGVSSATQPIYGFNYGAKQFGRVRQTFKTAVIAAFFISGIWYLIFKFLPRQLAYVFVGQNELYLEFSEHCFKLFMAAFFLYAIPMVISSFFQAIGKPLKSLIISLSRHAVFLIPLSICLSGLFGLGLDGALYAAPISDVLTFILAALLGFFEFRGQRFTKES